MKTQNLNEHPISSTLKSTWITILAVAIAYMVFAKLSHFIKIPPGDISPIFFSAGIALAAAIKFGRPALLGVFLGSFLNNIISYPFSLLGLFISIFIGIGAMTGSGVGAYLVRHLCKNEHPLSSGKNVIFLIFTGAVFSCAISPSIGVFILSLSGIIPWEQFYNSFIAWWIGDVSGSIFITPLILALDFRSYFRKNLLHIIEAILLVFISLLFSYFIFFQGLPVSYCISLILVYAAFRFGILGVSALAFIITIIATVSVSMGNSMYFGYSTKFSIIHMSLFLSISSISALILAGIIYEQKQLESMLHENEDRYRNLSSITTEGIMVSENNVIIDVNKAFTNILGYDDPQDLIGKNDMDVVKFIPESEQRVHAYILSSSTESYDLELTNKDGRIITIETSGIDSTFRGRSVRIVRIRDITERKRAEEEKESLQSKLIQAQKMESVGRLAGGVAHDFNNLLSVIIGHTELSMMKLLPSESVYASLKVIKDSAIRSADLIRQLLAFARKQTIAPKVLDLNNTIDGMLKMLRRLIGEDINLVWVPGADLWQVKIDSSQVDQLLANLCVNARDAISEVGKVTIETENIVFDEDYCAVHTGFVPGEYVMLAVSDDGIGMNKEVLDHLFEPFFTTKELGKGTGLGLSTIYGIVKQNNGFINVYSEPDKGSTFRIYLPRLAGEAVKHMPAIQLEMPKGRGEKLLLVEDEAMMLNVCSEMLDTLGYKVLTAGTPGEAIRLAKENAADLQLLITDVVMPEMNGKELAKLVSEIKPGIKCLFASGYTANVIAHRGVLDEGINFIQKPFSIQNLASKVREVLERE